MKTRTRDWWWPPRLPSLAELNDHVGESVYLGEFPDDDVAAWMLTMHRATGFDYSVFQVIGPDALDASVGIGATCVLKRPFPGSDAPHRVNEVG